MFVKVVREKTGCENLYECKRLAFRPISFDEGGEGRYLDIVMEDPDTTIRVDCESDQLSIYTMNNEGKTIGVRWFGQTRIPAAAAQEGGVGGEG